MFKDRSFLIKLVKDTPTGETEEVDAIEEVKNHFDRNKIAYGLGTIIGIIGITALVTKGGANGLGGSGPSLTGAEHSVTVLNVVSGKNNAIHNVAYISSNRQGPPSWVIRCLETNEIFASQHAAATAKGISESNLSQHLNGLQPHVSNLHFERLCMAA